jgi:hypothetical protein
LGLNSVKKVEFIKQSKKARFNKKFRYFIACIFFTENKSKENFARFLRFGKIKVQLKYAINC